MRKVTFLNNQLGMSLIEVVIVSGIMGVVMMAFLSTQQNQMKSSNYLEFQLKRTQLQTVLVGQFLNDASNCACLFEGATAFPATPAAPGATLAGVAPTEIGRYDFVTPGDCSTATVPQPFLTAAGSDGMKSASISLTRIMNISGTYSGELVVDAQSTKPVMGPQNLQIRVPVSITTVPAGGGNVTFTGCSIGAATAPTGPDLIGPNGYTTMPNGLVVQWGSVVIAGDSGGQYVPFPMAFPNAVFSVTANGGDGAGCCNWQDNPAQVVSVTTAGATFRQSSDAANTTYWIAIGN